jgi:hypothetical protein
MKTTVKKRCTTTAWTGPCSTIRIRINAFEQPPVRTVIAACTGPIPIEFAPVSGVRRALARTAPTVEIGSATH